MIWCESFLIILSLLSVSLEDKCDAEIHISLIDGGVAAGLMEVIKPKDLATAERFAEFNSNATLTVKYQQRNHSANDDKEETRKYANKDLVSISINNLNARMSIFFDAMQHRQFQNALEHLLAIGFLLEASNLCKVKGPEDLTAGTDVVALWRDGNHPKAIRFYKNETFKLGYKRKTSNAMILVAGIYDDAIQAIKDVKLLGNTRNRKVSLKKEDTQIVEMQKYIKHIYAVLTKVHCLVESNSTYTSEQRSYRNFEGHIASDDHGSKNEYIYDVENTDDLLSGILPFVAAVLLWIIFYANPMYNPFVIIDIDVTVFSVTWFIKCVHEIPAVFIYMISFSTDWALGLILFYYMKYFEPPPIITWRERYGIFMLGG